MPHLPFVAALLGAAICCGAQDPAPAFALPPPPLAGHFANLLRDELDLARDGAGLVANGRLSGQPARVAATVAADGFLGKARIGDGAADEVPCTGRLDGEALLVRIGDREWRLLPETPLDPTLAELGEPVVDPTRQWTVAIYLAGDNSLENAAVRDLLEMQRGMPESGCEVLVLIDRHQDADDDANDWSDARLLRVRPGSDGTFERLGEPAERDMGDPTTLASFTAGVFTRYPAAHHAVFVWDHGGGWTGICTDEQAPGHAGTTRLGLGDLRRGLRTGLQAAGIAKLDLLAFDACLMAQLDVALAVHDLASTMLASEATVPGSGYPYTETLPLFAGDRSGRDIGKAIVDAFGAFSAGEFESGSTLCAFDLQRAPGIARRLDALAREALAAAPSQWRAIARALFYAECYEVRSERVGDDACGSIDLIDLSSRLRGIPGIADDTLDALQLQVAQMIFARFTGDERTLSKGLSIYGPHRSGQYQAGYDNTPLGLGSAWRPLLAKVHELADGDHSDLSVGDVRQLDAFGKPSAVAKPFGGDRLLFTATGNSIVEVQERDWQYDEGEQRWLLLRAQLVTDPLWPARWAKAAAADLVDLVMPQFTEGENPLYFEIGGLSFAVTDGTLQTYGSLDMTAPSMQAPITAVARFTELGTGTATLVQVSFDRAEWRMVAMQPIERPAADSPARTLAPAAGDTFEFWLLARGADGTETGLFTPPLTYGEQGLALVATADEPGRYRAELTARTMQGRTATASFDYEMAENPDLAAWPASWQDFDPTLLVGTWSQFVVTGPQQYRDLQTTCEVSATTAANLFTVVAKGGPSGDEFETHPVWLFEWRGLPCLRIVTHIVDGQKFGWYGPVRVGEKDGKRFLAMKALNTAGVVWEWRQQ